MTAEPDDAPANDADRFLRAVIDATDAPLALPAPRLPPAPPPLPEVPTAAQLSIAVGDGGAMAALHQETPLPPPARRWPLTWLLAFAAVSLSGVVVWWTELKVGDPGAVATQLASASTADPVDPGRASRPALQNAAEGVPAAMPRIAQATRLPDATAASEVPLRPAAAAAPALRVAAEITVEAGGTSPLPIAIEPASLAAGGGHLIVRGLPDGTSLSRGRRNPSGSWACAVTEIGGLAVTAPPTAGGQHRLEIELRSSDAVLLAAAQTSLVIPPTSAAPAMSDPARVSEQTTLQWLEEGKKLIAMGRIAAARLILERAADNGLGQAALMLGDTYDPAKLYALGVRGMSGDVNLAIRWYERADELGEPLAKARLSALAPP